MSKLLRKSTSFLFGFLGMHVIGIVLDYFQVSFGVLVRSIWYLRLLIECASVVILDQVVQLVYLQRALRGNVFLPIARVKTYLSIPWIDPTDARSLSTLVLYAIKESTALECLFSCIEQFVLFAWLLNLFSSVLLFRRMLFSYLYWHYVLFFNSVSVIHEVDIVGGLSAALFYRHTFTFKATWVIFLPRW